MRTFSKRQAFAYGWHRFKERPFFLIGLFIITTVISAVSGVVADITHTGAVGTTLGLLDFAVQMVLGMGMTLILLRVYDQVDTDYGDLLEPLRLFWRYLAMSILVLVAVVIGLVLFIIPGIIAGIALAFAPYLVIDQNRGPVEALKESLHITHGHRWNLFVFGVLLLLFNLAGALLFGLGLLVTVPVSALAAVHVYRWLAHPPEDRGIEEVSLLTKVVSVVGVLILAGVGVLVAFSMLVGVTEQAAEGRDALRRDQITDIQLAAELYHDVNDRYPETVRALVPEYLNNTPVDPSTGEPYSYTQYAGGSDYEVCVILEMGDERLYCKFGQSGK